MSWFQFLRRRRAQRSEIDADIESYLSEKTDDLIARGVPGDEAAQRARREFGNVTLTKEISSEQWSAGWLDQAGGDIRYALRGLRHHPGFTLTAILTLALGIGANAAIFNLLHAVILSTLPVPDAQQLRFLDIRREGDKQGISYPVLLEMQNAAGSQAQVAGFASVSSMQMQGASGTVPVRTQMVSGNFFTVLQAPMQTGLALNSGDDKTTGNFPAVISDAFWSKQFDRDPAIIGKQLNINGTPLHVVGVAHSDFFGLLPGVRPDVWLPLSAQHDLRYNHNVWNSNGDSNKSFLPQPQIRWLDAVVRIPDASHQQRAKLVFYQIHHRDMQREAKDRDDPLEARSLLESRVELIAGDKGLGDLRQNLSTPLLVLMGAAGLVLLIASVNLASLALARVMARRKEIAVRCSIGATRGRIVSQLLTEVLAISFIGGLLAIPVALGVSNILVHWASSGDAVALNIGLRLPILLFVLGASVISGLIFGLLPAMEGINFPLAEAFKSGSTAVKGMRLPWGRTLIALQVMFSFVLLTGALLFVRTFINYTNIRMGFAPDHVLSLRIDPRGAHYAEDQVGALYRRVIDQVRQAPGVESAAASSCPLARGCRWTSGIRIAGRPPEDLSIQEGAVSPDYFFTVGMRLLSGRLLSEHDLAAKPIYTVINTAAAQRFFPHRNPIGQHFGYGGDVSRFEIVGVVADARINDLHEPAPPMAYHSMNQDPTFAAVLEVRVKGDPASAASAIRNAIRTAAPNLPVLEAIPLKRQVGNNLQRERLVAKLASAFALLAVGLACLGVYGVLSYAISRRTSEIGIRLALGAAARSVRWMVLREAFGIILAGLALGIPAALFVTNSVRGLLFGLSPSDPASLALAIAALVLIGLIAAYLPANRASRLDPNIALRTE